MDIAFVSFYRRRLLKHQGFTLIELIIVIVILGVLAVTAAPRFINISSDAKISKIESIRSSMQTAIDLTYAKAQIQGQLGNNVSIDTGLLIYEFWSGYPENKSEASTPNEYFIENFINIGEPLSEEKNNATRTAYYADIIVWEANNISRVGFPDSDGSIIGGNCYTQYAHTETTAEVSMVISGC